ncbi:Neuronal growth regulator 1 [Desmophyllum pertusum]|uniref:Neuronal growth regulator 1 n=1 Tax=Desmophyllum pertusum TaxID=174260 RepID=A0A9X0D4Z5_9CNID|nr:Neuronal growth regulator 1 [Desmophyllum pertusum]
MTVDPGSNITLDCSIVTGGLVEGITWEQAKQRVEKSTGSSDLVLQQYNSKNNGNYPCKCTAIHFPRALQIVLVTSSPNDIIQNKSKELECFFSGWPLPLAVSWYKDDKLITNGTQGMYHSEKLKWKKGEKNSS